MKRILTILLTLLLASVTAFAQESMTEGVNSWANEWKYAFSKDGVKEWKPEFTVRYYAGLFTTGPMITGGVRVDEKRSFALFVSQAHEKDFVFVVDIQFVIIIHIFMVYTTVYNIFYCIFSKSLQR